MLTYTDFNCDTECTSVFWNTYCNQFPYVNMPLSTAGPMTESEFNLYCLKLRKGYLEP